MEMSREEFLRLHKDIQQQKTSSPSFAYFNQAKILAFYNKNQKLLDFIYKKLGNLYEIYMDLDENGNPLVLEEPGKQRAFKYKSAQHHQDFENEYQQYMSRMITVQ